MPRKGLLDEAHLQEHRVEALYVEAGSPWQNGIVESFNGRLREECPDVESFYCLEEARVVIGDYRVYYRDRRPHSALGYTTPAKDAAACIANGGVHPSAAAISTPSATGASCLPGTTAAGERAFVGQGANSSGATLVDTLGANAPTTRIGPETGAIVERVLGPENRVDGEGGEAPSLSKHHPPPPEAHLSNTRTEHVVNSNHSLAVAQERQAGHPRCFDAAIVGKAIR